MSFSLLATDMLSFYLLIALRLLEMCLLLWYLRGRSFRIQTVPAIAVFSGVLLIYSLVYEIRSPGNAVTSLPLLLLVTLVHISSWYGMLRLFYRTGHLFSLNCTLLFYLLTRTHRWFLISVWYTVKERVSVGFYSIIPFGAVLLILLALLTDRMAPADQLSEDPRCPAALTPLIGLYLYIRYFMNSSDQRASLTGLSVTAVTFLLITAGSLLIEYLFIHSAQEAQQKIMLAAANKQYEDLLKRMENDTGAKQLYHDINKQIQAIQRLGTSESVETDAWLSDLKQRLAETDSLVNTGNLYCDAILTEYLTRFSEDSVHAVTDVDLHHIDFIRPFDLCSLYSNLLDNALEAAKELPSSENRQVLLKTRVFRQFLSIKESNYFCPSPDFDILDLRTGKTNPKEHGFGVRSIRQVVEKYGGTVSFHVKEGNIFTVNILIPLPGTG